MSKILINGNFLCRNLTGVERFAYEVCVRLDALIEKDADCNVSMLVPANARTIPGYRHITLIQSPEEIHRFPLWDMGTFAAACRKHKATGLSFSNTAPLGRTCGIAFIHDIYADECPQDFITLRDRLIRLYSRLQFRNITRNARKIVTVSEFSKQQIQQKYHVPDERITVIGNGWDHFKSVIADSRIFDRFPILAERPFYFTLGSLSKRKNLIWIAQYARKNPSELFAVSGKAISGLVPDELKELKELENVILLGYVSDGEVKSLMEHCKAFVFPSYYEGFGIPPLEALSAGAQIVIARAASLPEIYGDTAHYINQDDTDVSLSSLLEEPVASAQKVLNTYTYDNAAKKLHTLLKTL